MDTTSAAKATHFRALIDAAVAHAESHFSRDTSSLTLADVGRVLRAAADKADPPVAKPVVHTPVHAPVTHASTESTHHFFPWSAIAQEDAE